MSGRHPPLTPAQIESRLVVDTASGRCFWKDPSKHHARLIGEEAGTPRPNRHGSAYWVIKLNGIPYRRSQIVVAVATGVWPLEMVDHKDGNTLNDKAENLRHATAAQNAWNHRTRAKRSPLPMGVRQLTSGRFQARVACHKKTFHLGPFDDVATAAAAYIEKRKELFNAYCPL